MPENRADAAMGELLAAFSCLEGAGLLDRLARTAATVLGAAYAGLVRIDPLREGVCAVHTHGPPGDPLRAGAWLRESGVLRTLRVSSAPVLLAPEAGVPGFLACPVPLATRDHAFLWVAGRGFDDGDEHLLGRFAIAAGRALEASSGLEAAVRLLRGVQAFTPSAAGQVRPYAPRRPVHRLAFQTRPVDPWWLSP